MKAEILDPEKRFRVTAYQLADDILYVDQSGDIAIKIYDEDSTAGLIVWLTGNLMGRSYTIIDVPEEKRFEIFRGKLTLSNV